MKYYLLLLLAGLCQSTDCLSAVSDTDVIVVVDEDDVTGMNQPSFTLTSKKKNRITGYPQGSEHAKVYETGERPRMAPEVARCILENIEKVQSNAAAVLVREACEALE